MEYRGQVTRKDNKQPRVRVRSHYYYSQRKRSILKMLAEERLQLQHDCGLVTFLTVLTKCLIKKLKKRSVYFGLKWKV